MKKQILLSVLAGSLIIVSCKKKSKDDISPDPFKLNYSNLSVEEQKQSLEQSGQDFVQKINSLPDEQFIDVLNHFAELDPSVSSEYQGFNNIMNVKTASQKKDVDAIFKAATADQTSTGTRSLSELYGIYTWNATTQSWDEAASDDRLEFHFPSSPQSSNNAVLTFTYETSGITTSAGDEETELPASLSTVLKVDNNELLNLTSSYEYKTDGTPVKADVNLVLGSYTLKSSVNNDASNLSTSLSLEKGGEKLLGLSMAVNGSLTLSNTDADPAQIINNANATFEIMNIKLAGILDFKGLSDAEAAIPEDASSEEQNKLETEAWNKYSQFVAVNTADNTLIAKNEFVAVEEADSYCYWDGNTQQDVCTPYSYFSMEPRLVFKDDSKYSFGTFFESGFDRLISDLDDLAGRFE